MNAMNVVPQGCLQVVAMVAWLACAALGQDEIVRRIYDCRALLQGEINRWPPRLGPLSGESEADGVREEAYPSIDQQSVVDLLKMATGMQSDGRNIWTIEGHMLEFTNNQLLFAVGPASVHERGLQDLVWVNAEFWATGDRSRCASRLRRVRLAPSLRVRAVGVRLARRAPRCGRGAGHRAGASRTLLAGRSPALPCRVGTPSRSRTLFQYRVRELPHADEAAGSHLRSWRGSLRLGPRVACWRARPRPLRPHPRTRRPLGSPRREARPQGRLGARHRRSEAACVAAVPQV